MTMHDEAWRSAVDGGGPRAELSADEEAWLGFGSDYEAEQLAARSAAALVAKTCAVKPFPRTAQRVIELTSGTEKHVREVVRVIETDPTLATRLLRYVNSAACGLKARCKSLHHAVTLLGPRRIRELVTSTAVLSMFERGDALSTEVLEHAAVTGAIARIVGERFGVPSEEMLACGLLHDLGKLMMLDSGDETYAGLLGVAGDDETLCRLEREQYGFDHAVLAAQMLIKWRIPAPIPRVVGWHHQPGRAHHAGGRVALMVEALRLADQVAETLSAGADSKEEMIEKAASGTAASYLGLSEEDLARLWPQLARAHRESRALFHGDDIALSEGLSESTQHETLGRRRDVAAGAPVADLACGICNEPSYGRGCGACGRPMCEGHDPGLGYCVECEAEFSDTADAPTAALVGTMLIGAASAGMMIVFSGFFEVDLSLGVGGAFALALGAGAGAAARRWSRRRSFRSANREAPVPTQGALVGSALAAVFGEGEPASVPEPVEVDDTRIFAPADLSTLIRLRPAAEVAEDVPPTDRSPTTTLTGDELEAVDVDALELAAEAPSLEVALDLPNLAGFVEGIGRPSGSVPYGESTREGLPALPVLRQPRASPGASVARVATLAPPNEEQDPQSLPVDRPRAQPLARVG